MNNYLKNKYTPEFLRNNRRLLLLDVIIGSHAYNLNQDHSDVDRYGIFIMEKEDYYSLNRETENFSHTVEKINPKDDDIVYHEIGKFISGLSKNNPNCLEILASANIPENCIYAHDLIKKIDINKILSKLSEKTFADYAINQIRKARGLNKKMMKPIAKKKLTPLDFSVIYNHNKDLEGSKTYDLKWYLEQLHYEQKFCGLVNLPSARDGYSIYYDLVAHDCFSEKYKTKGDREEKKRKRNEIGLPLGYGLKGIEIKGSNELRTSSIPKDKGLLDGLQHLGFVSYNKDGYMSYCKYYTEYWKWKENRNEERYNTSLKQGYDIKNMTHCIRLLSVAKEIGEGKGLIVRRTEDRDYLMKIRTGQLEYDEVINYADQLMENLNLIYKSSKLLTVPNFEYLNKQLITLRKTFYG